MKQIYLIARGRMPQELRSDTLFGLLMWGVRQVCGRAALERLFSPMDNDPPKTPLCVSSAFPFADRKSGRVHWFPRPGTSGDDWMEDRELLAFVSGREPPACASAPSMASSQTSGRFFLAEGPAEVHLEAALHFLSRFGLGSGGRVGFDFEIKEAEFLRLARAGEQGFLLSLFHPTEAESKAIQASAANDPEVQYRVERRAGVTGGRLLDPDRRWQQPVAMLREGAVLPVLRDQPGSAPVVGAAMDGDSEFSVRRNGFGFLVPISGGA